MIKTQEMVDTLSPVELETIDRVLKRLNERLLLSNIDKEDAGAVAATLYRCGFTREDRLLDQLATSLATLSRRARPQVGQLGRSCWTACMRPQRPLHEILADSKELAIEL